MEKKKNIILLTGKNWAEIDRYLEKYISLFRERQSGENIDQYFLEDIRDWRTVEQNMQSMGLFVEKRLFIFHIPAETKKTDTRKSEISEKGQKKEKKSAETEESLLRICEGADEDTIIIFSWHKDMKGALYAWLKANADTKEYDDIFSLDTWSSRFSDLDDATISTVLRQYRSSVEKIEDVDPEISYAIRESLEKLSLLGIRQTITPKDIVESVSQEKSGKLFDLVDAILAAERKKALDIFKRISHEMTIYAFLPSFIGLIRGSVYTRFLKYHGETESQVASIIKSHPYVIKKAYTSRVTWDSLRDFYTKIIAANMAYRSGKGLKDPELGRIFEIERAIMGLKK